MTKITDLSEKPTNGAGSQVMRAPQWYLVACLQLFYVNVASPIGVKEIKGLPNLLLLLFGEFGFGSCFLPLSYCSKGRFLIAGGLRAWMKGRREY